MSLKVAFWDSFYLLCILMTHYKKYIYITMITNHYLFKFADVLLAMASSQRIDLLYIP